MHIIHVHCLDTVGNCAEVLCSGGCYALRCVRPFLDDVEWVMDHIIWGWTCDESTFLSRCTFYRSTPGTAKYGPDLTAQGHIKDTRV